MRKMTDEELKKALKPLDDYMRGVMMATAGFLLVFVVVCIFIFIHKVCV